MFFEDLPICPNHGLIAETGFASACFGNDPVG